MVNKLCLKTDVESFFIIPIILLQLLTFLSRCLLKSSLLSKTVLRVSVMTIDELGYG